MRKRAIAVRLPIALSALLTLGIAGGCHRSEQTPESRQGGSAGGLVELNPPSGLPKLAAAARKKARHWHSDAVLVNLEVKRQGGQFQTTFDFYAPSDMTGYIVMKGIGPGSDQAVGTANWGTQPIPSDFADFPDAVAAMRARGMKGLVSGGTLSAVRLCGIMPVTRWKVSPANTEQPLVNDFDVYFYADPESAPKPMDWRQADELADKTRKGDATAWASLRQAAERGDPNAATNLGYLFAVGAPGVGKDFSQAGSWFCAAAYQGSPAAEFDLGLMFEKGWGVDQSWAGEAGNLYYPAAIQGLPEAQLNFGVRIWRIQPQSNLPKTEALARQWWRKAAAQGINAANKNISAIGAWNGRYTAFNQVSLLERTTFVEARDWNPSAKGIIPASRTYFPDRFPPSQGWTPAQE